MKKVVLFSVMMVFFPLLVFAEGSLSLGASGSESGWGSSDLSINIGVTSNSTLSGGVTVFQGATQIGTVVVAGWDLSLGKHWELMLGFSGQPVMENQGYLGFEGGIARVFGENSWVFTPSIGFGAAYHDQYLQITTRRNSKITFRGVNISPGFSLSYDSSSTLNFTCLFTRQTITTSSGEISLDEYQKISLTGVATTGKLFLDRGGAGSTSLSLKDVSIIDRSFSISFFQDFSDWFSAGISYSLQYYFLPRVISLSPLTTAVLIDQNISLDITFNPNDKISIDLIPSYYMDNAGGGGIAGSLVLGLNF